eukprot:scaffold14128_cov83-Cyclotella_meneghiniana.AAC.2
MAIEVIILPFSRTTRVDLRVDCFRLFIFTIHDAVMPTKTDRTSYRYVPSSSSYLLTLACNWRCGVTERTYDGFICRFRSDASVLPMCMLS